MPVPTKRDTDLARKKLAEWLHDKTGADDVAVGELSGPAASGFSNETIIFDATWDGETRRLVARVAPSQYTVFMESEFETQYRVMKILSDNDVVPIPTMRWFEPSDEWLGAPFWIMDFVEGEVPSDSPFFTQGGWLLEAAPAQQAQLHRSGLEAMAKLHTCDWEALGLGFLDRPHRGRTGIEQQLTYYDEAYAWAKGQSIGDEFPVLDAAFAWLHEHMPEPGSEPIRLVWGDARVGNQMFKDFECVAVLDWEMVSLGSPVIDLAWWIFLNRHHSEAVGVPQHPGFPSVEDTARQWSELTGLTVTDDELHYYQVFSGVRFGVVMMRISQMGALLGLMPPELAVEIERNSPPVQLGAKDLGLPMPG
jgi:aminoglycoside phosphotransferase (APT) family kinase protein